MTAADAAPPGPGVSPRARRLVAAIGVGLVVAAALAILLIRVQRHHAQARQRRDLAAEQARGARILVTRVSRRPLGRVLTLPGDVRGFNQATVYAKIAGYVRDVAVERGQRVAAGTLLATIESPETRKDVASARHDARLMARNAARARSLAPTGVVTQQDLDTAVIQSRIARANLQRARDILQYTAVRAPFAGTITARYVDPGALLPAATGSTQSALPVVDIADTDQLRIFVYVGQDMAPFVRVGDPVTLWQNELPEMRIPAAVTRTAGALDPRTRTMEVEIDLDNRRWRLLPGTFARVELRPNEPPTLVVPDNAVTIRDGRTEVAVIRDGRAHYVPVDLGYNDGRGVRVLRGLAGGETIGLDVPVAVGDGAVVQAVPADKPQ